jgi:hypothetical protein
LITEHPSQWKSPTITHNSISAGKWPNTHPDGTIMITNSINQFRSGFAAKPSLGKIFPFEAFWVLEVWLCACEWLYIFPMGKLRLWEIKLLKAPPLANTRVGSRT